MPWSIRKTKQEIESKKEENLEEWEIRNGKNGKKKNGIILDRSPNKEVWAKSRIRADVWKVENKETETEKKKSHMWFISNQENISCPYKVICMVFP